MEINWRTIEKDGIPPVGTDCLCKQEHDANAYRDYEIYRVANVAGNRMFMMYDLVVPIRKIIKYIPISELDNENKDETTEQKA